MAEIPRFKDQLILLHGNPPWSEVLTGIGSHNKDAFIIAKGTFFVYNMNLRKSDFF